MYEFLFVAVVVIYFAISRPTSRATSGNTPQQSRHGGSATAHDDAA